MQIRLGTMFLKHSTSGRSGEGQRSVAASGYDLVLSLGKVIRHVQLKASMHDAKAASQPIQECLGTHQSGCVVWIG